VSLRIRGRQDRPARSAEDMVAVYVSRDDIAAAGPPRAGGAETIAEFAPVPRYTIQDVLLGHITWEELTRASA